MMRVLVFVPMLVVTVLAGCLGTESEPHAESGLAIEQPAAPRSELKWDGYLRVGAADRFAHTRETEPLVAPLARMGFLLVVPEGAQWLQFRLTWPPGEPMHLMTHGPEEAGMPTYMSDMGNWPTNGDVCFGIPPAEILPGVWKVMAHGQPRALDLAFRITVEVAASEEASVLSDAHGHAMDGAMEMEMLPTDPCR